MTLLSLLRTCTKRLVGLTEQNNKHFFYFLQNLSTILFYLNPFVGNSALSLPNMKLSLGSSKGFFKARSKTSKRPDVPDDPVDPDDPDPGLSDPPKGDLTATTVPFSTLNMKSRRR